MILILEGIVFRKTEMITFANAITNKTAMDITIAGSNLTVIANAEQIPRTCTVIGLFRLIGSVNNFEFLLIVL